MSPPPKTKRYLNIVHIRNEDQLTKNQNAYWIFERFDIYTLQSKIELFWEPKKEGEKLRIQTDRGGELEIR